MTLMSMTGFGQATSDIGGASVRWELRSVNSRGLDLRFRLPPRFEHLDTSCRALAGRKLHRGSVQAVLTIEEPAHTAPSVVNEARLAAILEWTDRLVAEGRAVLPQADGLLSLKGVLDGPREDPRDPIFDERLETAALDAFERALAELWRSRAIEGAHIATAISGHVDLIASLAAAARNDRSRTPDAIRSRIAAQIRSLIDSDVDESRLVQELAILAVRSDIEEELDRLESHIGSARTLLASDEPVGRRFDFLAQEMNRESNTICSKSHAVSLSKIGLELKIVVDQLREQVQNIE